MEPLTTVHQLLGYAVVLGVLAVAVASLLDATEPRRGVVRGPHLAVVVAVDVQVLGGLAIYTVGGYWDHPSALVSMVHPALAIAGLVAGHLSLRWARSGATVGRLRRAGIGLLAVLVLLAGAVAAASVGLRTGT